MQFLYPTFLYALLLLAVPIIIHLFYFRRFKKVYFTKVDFLKEVKEETSMRSKLRNLLVLLARLLALAALIFAFAQPFISKRDNIKRGVKSVSVFIDNSQSMTAKNAEVPLLELAKQKAREVINAYGEADRFQIITHDLEGRHQNIIDKQKALVLVDEVRITSDVVPINKVILKQKSAFSREGVEDVILYEISDFQRSICDDLENQDTTLEIRFVAIQNVSENNVSIDSCWFDAPVQMENQSNRLVIKMKNYGSEEEEVNVNVHIDGKTIPVGVQTIAAGEILEDTMDVSVRGKGWHNAVVKITDYPIQFDDSYYFSFDVPETFKILSINKMGFNRYIDAAFSSDEQFEMVNKNISQIDYSKMSENKLIILNEIESLSSGLVNELRKYVETGGNLIFFPSKNGNIKSYNDFFAEMKSAIFIEQLKGENKCSYINTGEFVFRDVYKKVNRNIKLPVVNSYFSLGGRGRIPSEVLLKFRNGASLLNKYSLGLGSFYQFTSPIDEEINDLVKNAEVFIPMMYKMAISNGAKSKIAYSIGVDETIMIENNLDSDKAVYVISNENTHFIPSVRSLGSQVVLGVEGNISEAGFYSLNREEEKIGSVAFNYNRKESDMTFLSIDELKEKNGVEVIDLDLRADLTQAISQRENGKILWQYFLFAALFFLFLEILILRFWKV